MLEISPVLAENYNSPDFMPAKINVPSAPAPPSALAATAAVADSAPADPRRYSQFDRTASQVGDATMSFGDVLDMVNPLQHIPVVSSLYRAITGDKINPVARIAGDILYGGAMGLASGLAAGVGAVADSVMEAKTGQDVKGTMLAELFGDDKGGAEAGDGTTQVAAAVASQALPAVAAQPAASATAQPAVQPPAVQTAQAFAVAPNKLPYGGVMAPANDPQRQNMMMALATATGGNAVRIGTMLYTNRAMTGPHPMPAAAAPTATAANNPAAGSTVSPSSPQTPATPTMPASAWLAMTGVLPSTAVPVSATPVPAPIRSVADNQTVVTPNITAAAAAPVAGAGNTISAGDTVLPKELGDDALIMKALGLYRNVAGSARSGGSVTGITTLN